LIHPLVKRWSHLTNRVISLSPLPTYKKIMLAIQQPAPTMRHFRARSESPTGTRSIKSAVAANLGSSMFLFQGLEVISPYVFSEAALQPSSRSTSPTSSLQSFETSLSGNKYRKSWFGSSVCFFFPFRSPPLSLQKKKRHGN